MRLVGAEKVYGQNNNNINKKNAGMMNSSTMRNTVLNFDLSLRYSIHKIFYIHEVKTNNFSSVKFCISKPYAESDRGKSM